VVYLFSELRAPTQCFYFIVSVLGPGDSLTLIPGVLFTWPVEVGRECCIEEQTFQFHIILLFYFVLRYNLLHSNDCALNVLSFNYFQLCYATFYQGNYIRGFLRAVKEYDVYN
jgi:hypothetical protein